MSFVDKHHANKKLSIWTSIITFLIGSVWTVRLIIIDKIPSKEEAIGIIILLLGLNSVSIGSDLRGFIQLIVNKDDKKDYKDNTKENTNNDN